MVYLAVALSAALGGFVQSITGFGAAVVMMTILPYFSPWWSRRRSRPPSASG